MKNIFVEVVWIFLERRPVQEFFLCVNECSHGCRGFTFAESNIVCGEYATKVSQESEPKNTDLLLKQKTNPHGSQET